MPRPAGASGQSGQTIVVERANGLEEYSCRERMQVSAACLLPRVAILSCFYFFLFSWRDASAHLSDSPLHICQMRMFVTGTRLQKLKVSCWNADAGEPTFSHRTQISYHDPRVSQQPQTLKWDNYIVYPQQKPRSARISTHSCTVFALRLQNEQLDSDLLASFGRRSSHITTFLSCFSGCQTWTDVIPSFRVLKPACVLY